QVLNSGRLVRADTALADALHRRTCTSPTIVDVAQGVSIIGSPPVLYVVVGTAALWCALRRLGRLAVFLVATCLLGGVVDTVVKVVVDRARPALEGCHVVAHGKSFPSGHAMSSTVAYGALLLVFLPLLAPRLRPWAISAAVALVLLIGLARQALGVHYLSDVLGGYVLGLAWLALATAAFEIWRSDRGSRRSHPLAEGLEPEDQRQLRRN
ncbi:MAG: phosphatase PAP2 family protein, partial [Mycobacteriales bacterium]